MVPGADSDGLTELWYDPVLHRTLVVGGRRGYWTSGAQRGAGQTGRGNDGSCRWSSVLHWSLVGGIQRINMRIRHET